MKWRYLLKAIACCWLLWSCSEEYMSFHGTDRIQFKTTTDEVYSFVYFPQSVQKDTLTIEIVSIGEVAEHDRTIKFEQVTKEWQYIYDEEEPSKIIDSVYVDMEYPAIEGIHYEPFGKAGELILPARKNVLRFDVVVKRDDIGLRENARYLILKLLPSEDFETGEVERLSKRIVISDKLERPTRWKKGSYYYDRYLGDYSEVKHRFMIDITQQKWDNDFLRYIINSWDTMIQRDYYLGKIKQALKEYNADPANNPPLKDENGYEVVFP